MKRFVMLVTVLAVGATLSMATRVHAAPPQGSITPPNDVYTCDWIARHPAAAAAAQVTCDPNARPPAGSSVFSSPIGASPASIEAQGCQWVPNGGAKVGQGVFAWSQFEYSNYWNYSVYADSSPNYTWYLQRPDGTNYTHGTVTDFSVHNVGVPANNYRWGAQNHSAVPAHWYACYTVV